MEEYHYKKVKVAARLPGNMVEVWILRIFDQSELFKQVLGASEDMLLKILSHVLKESTLPASEQSIYYEIEEGNIAEREVVKPLTISLNKTRANRSAILADLMKTGMFVGLLRSFCIMEIESVEIQEMDKEIEQDTTLMWLSLSEACYISEFRRESINAPENVRMFTSSYSWCGISDLLTDLLLWEQGRESMLTQMSIALRIYKEGVDELENFETPHKTINMSHEKSEESMFNMFREISKFYEN